jgi:hypothetical protein
MLQVVAVQDRHGYGAPFNPDGAQFAPALGTASASLERLKLQVKAASRIEMGAYSPAIGCQKLAFGVLLSQFSVMARGRTVAKPAGKAQGQEFLYGPGPEMTACDLIEYVHHSVWQMNWLEQGLLDWYGQVLFLGPDLVAKLIMERAE